MTQPQDPPIINGPWQPRTTALLDSPRCYLCGKRLDTPHMHIGLTYCDAQCAELDLWACGSCGEDRRSPADPRFGPVMCPYHVSAESTTGAAR